MPHILLVHGLKESGKSTIAKYLKEKHNYVIIKLAATLKNMLRSLMKDANIDVTMIERYIEGDLKEFPIPEFNGITSRHLMETLGHDWRNLQSSDFWINITMNKIKHALENGENVIVDDIRYIEELQKLGIYKNHKIVITRGDYYLTVDQKTSFEGERPIPTEYFDIHIKNDAGLEELFFAVENTVEVINKYRVSLEAVANF